MPKPTQDCLPVELDAAQLQKGSVAIANLLVAGGPNRSQCKSSPDTVLKSINVILTQMLAHVSAEIAQHVLQLVSCCLKTFAESMLDHPDARVALEAFVELYKKEGCGSLLGVSPPALSRNLDRISAATADHCLGAQAGVIQGNLKKQCLWPTAQVLVVDPTDEPYFGKYVNQGYNWGLVGQQNTYKRVFKENVIYASPAQLFLDNASLPIRPKKENCRPFPLWISRTQHVLRSMRATGTTIPLVVGDRAFNDSLGMAYAYFGLFLPEVPPGGNPRLLCPAKLGSEGDAAKWNFLMDEKMPAVQPDTMGLTFYDAKYLGSRIGVLELNDKRDHREVPIARVAVFDPYLRGENAQSLSWAHGRAQKIDRKLEESGTNIKAAESTYLLAQPQKKGGKPKPMSYHGKCRTKFASSQERTAYQECWKWHHKREYWRKKKAALCARLLLYNVSLRQNETIEACADELLALVDFYHERWQIEIGFKLTKHVFRVRTNCRRPTGRHVRRVLGEMMYNAWHYTELTRLARESKARDPAWTPFIMERGISRKNRHNVKRWKGSATGYILQELTLTLKITLKRMVASL